MVERISPSSSSREGSTKSEEAASSPQNSVGESLASRKGSLGEGSSSRASGFSRFFTGVPKFRFFQSHAQSGKTDGKKGARSREKSSHKESSHKARLGRGTEPRFKGLRTLFASFRRYFRSTKSWFRAQRGSAPSASLAPETVLWGYRRFDHRLREYQEGLARLGQGEGGAARMEEYAREKAKAKALLSVAEIRGGGMAETLSQEEMQDLEVCFETMDRMVLGKKLIDVPPYQLKT